MLETGLDVYMYIVYTLGVYLFIYIQYYIVHTSLYISICLVYTSGILLLIYQLHLSYGQFVLVNNWNNNRWFIFIFLT